MSEFLFSPYVSSTCFGPHRSTIRSVLYKLYSQIWYVVLLCVLLDTSSCYFVTAGRDSLKHFVYLVGLAYI